MLDFTNMFIRQPRVPSTNAATTFPPKTSGTFVFENSFSLQYTGSGTAFLQIDALAFRSVVSSDLADANSLDLNIKETYKTLSSLVNAVTGNPNYTITSHDPANDSKPSFLFGVDKQDISSPFVILAGETEEYIIEAGGTGDFGSVDVNYTGLPFEFSRTEQRWVSEDPFDVLGLPVPVGGVTTIDTKGVVLELTENAADNDLTDSLSVVDSVSLEAAVDGQFDLLLGPLKTIQPGFQFFKNGVAITDGVDYYITTATGKMTFTSPVAGTLVDPAPANFSVANITNPADVGLGIILGEATRDISGNIISIAYSFSVTQDTGSGPVAFTPDVDVILPNAGEFNGRLLGNGQLHFVEVLSGSAPTELILHPEESLFADDFIAYRNGTQMTFGDEYSVVTDTGYISLVVPAFPGEVFTFDYVSKDSGEIVGELLSVSKTAAEIAEDAAALPIKALGSKPSITSANASPYAVDAGTTDTLTVSVGVTVTNVSLTPGLSVSTETIVQDINTVANGFSASESTDSKIILTADAAGPTADIKIGSGNANAVLGFTTGEQVFGSGAAGGESLLLASFPPIVTSSFSAPSGGDTIIIKNASVTANYPTNAVVQINTDFYVVNSASLDNIPNLISSNGGTFNISVDVNNKLKIKQDGVTFDITITTGAGRTNQNIVDDINLIQAGLAQLININNSDLIRVVGTSSVELLPTDFSAYSLLGFEVNSKDDSRPDTVIEVDGLFVQDYANPTFNSTRAAVTFSQVVETVANASPGQNKIVFLSNLIGQIVLGMLLKVSSNDPTTATIVPSLYSVSGVALLDTGFTEVTLGSNLKFPLFTGDQIDKTTKSLLEKNSTTFFLTPLPYLGLFPPIQDVKFDLTYDGVLQERGVDYKVDESGKVDLETFTLDGKPLSIDYIGRKPVVEGSKIETSYTIAKGLVEGDSIKGTYTFLNPDQFYVQIKRHLTLAEKMFEDIETEIQQLNNPSSSGVSTEAPSSGQDNEEGGNATPAFELAVPTEKSIIAQEYFSFYNNRIVLVEDMLTFVNGDNPGGADGKITQANIDDAVDSPFSRFFPEFVTLDSPPEDNPTTGVSGTAGDSYTENDPLNLPILRGLSQGDDGTAFVDLETERNALGVEEQAFADLLAITFTASPTVKTVQSITASNNVVTTNYEFDGLASIVLSVLSNSQMSALTDPTLVTLEFTYNLPALGPSITEVMSAINGAFTGVATLVGVAIIEITEDSIRMDSATVSSFVKAGDQGNFSTVTVVDAVNAISNYEEYADRQNHSQQLFFRNNRALTVQRTALTKYQTNLDSLLFDDLANFTDINTFITDVIDEIELDLTDAEVNSSDVTTAYLSGARTTLITDRLNDVSAEITRLKNIEDTLLGFITTDGLRDLRYIWLIKLINKIEGFLQRIKFIEKDQADKARKKAQNEALL